MFFVLKDIVFQNDRYFLLFDKADELMNRKGNIYEIYVDDRIYGELPDAEMSKILMIPDHSILESKQNLNKLEGIFRKTRQVKICLKDRNV